MNTSALAAILEITDNEKSHQMGTVVLFMLKNSQHLRTTGAKLKLTLEASESNVQEVTNTNLYSSRTWKATKNKSTDDSYKTYKETRGRGECNILGWKSWYINSAVHHQFWILISKQAYTSKAQEQHRWHSKGSKVGNKRNQQHKPNIKCGSGCWQ